MDTRFYVGIGVAALLLGGVLYVLFFKGPSSVARCEDASPRPTILAIGDSLVEGYGAPKGSDFVTKLSEQLGVPILNYGKSGDTTAQGLVRAKALQEYPDVVIILLGGNDVLQKVPVSQTKENLKEIIELFQSYQSKQIRVVLVGVLGGFPKDPLASMYKELAQEHGVTYVPNILSGLIGNKSFMSDQIHPNALGYEKIAERLTPVVNAECRAYNRR